MMVSPVVEKNVLNVLNMLNDSFLNGTIQQNVLSLAFNLGVRGCLESNLKLHNYILTGTTIDSDFRPWGVINVLVFAISLQEGALITTLCSLSVLNIGFK